VKETLESSLFEAQQHLSQLKIQLGTVTQAKEAIQGESVTCFVSGDPLPRQGGIKTALCLQCF